MKTDPDTIKSKPPRWVRIVRSLLFVSLVLATLIALLYAEENWRGARAWAECKKWLESRGESLDRASVIPPPIPDDQNFAMTPLLREMVTKQRQSHLAAWRNQVSKEVEVTDPTNGIGKMPVSAEASVNGRTFNRWQKYLSTDTGAQSVLEAINRVIPEVDELERAAAERPLARCPVSYDAASPFDVRLSYPLTVMPYVEMLCLRARAAIVWGDTARARRDLLLSLRLSEIMANEPFLLSVMVRSTGASLMVRAMRDGMAARRWTADDLSAFSGALQQIDLLQGFQLAIRGERILFTNTWFDYLKSRSTRSKAVNQVLLPNGGTLWVLPDGWLDLNKVAINVYEQTYLIEAIDPKQRRIDFDRVAVGEKQMNDLRWSPSTVFLRLAGPVFGSQTQKAAEAQASVDQAITACALEKYFLDKGEYPADAVALVPAYLDHLPTGVVDGKPINYSRTEDGRYRLAFAARGSGKSGDEWVWKYTDDPKQ